MHDLCFVAPLRRENRLIPLWKTPQHSLKDFFFLFKGGLLSMQNSASYSHKFTSGSWQTQLQSSTVGFWTAALRQLRAERLFFQTSPQYLNQSWNNYLRLWITGFTWIQSKVQNDNNTWANNSSNLRPHKWKTQTFRLAQPFVHTNYTQNVFLVVAMYIVLYFFYRFISGISASIPIQELNCGAHNIEKLHLNISKN